MLRRAAVLCAAQAACGPHTDLSNWPNTESSAYPPSTTSFPTEKHVSAAQCSMNQHLTLISSAAAVSVELTKSARYHIDGRLPPTRSTAVEYRPPCHSSLQVTSFSLQPEHNDPSFLSAYASTLGHRIAPLLLFAFASAALSTAVASNLSLGTGGPPYLSRLLAPHS